MKQIGRISIGAVVLGTVLSVVFYRFTSIPITGGLASLFALIGLLMSWTTFAVAHAILKRRTVDSQTLTNSAKRHVKDLGRDDTRKPSRNGPKARGHK
jgi:hypothetical protein